MSVKTVYVDETPYDESSEGIRPIDVTKIGPTNSVQMYCDKVHNIVGIIETFGEEK